MLTTLGGFIGAFDVGDISVTRSLSRGLYGNALKGLDIQRRPRHLFLDDSRHPQKPLIDARHLKVVRTQELQQREEEVRYRINL